VRALIRFSLKNWPALAFVASGALLAVAHAFQSFGGLAPCTLCLWQRQVYWDALPIAALAFVVERTRWRLPLAPLAGAALTVTFLAGMGIAAYHAGAEWKWWPGPTTCSGGASGVDAAGLVKLMQGAKIAAPRCDEAAWRFLGLSMAGWNVLISLKLAVFSGAWAVTQMTNKEAMR
jgi:disulfide bond formation protein DsbB